MNDVANIEDRLPDAGTRPALPEDLGPIKAAEIILMTGNLTKHRFSAGLDTRYAEFTWDELLTHVEYLEEVVCQGATAYLKVAHTNPPQISYWWWRMDTFGWARRIGVGLLGWYDDPTRQTEQAEYNTPIARDSFAWAAREGVDGILKWG